jgi:putative inorganic carbon (hco3(-)) transporter
LTLQQPGSRAVTWGEGLLLLAVAPWLLFPSVVPALTAVALFLLALGWLILWAITRRPFPATPYNAALLLWLLALAVGIGVTADPDLTLPKATGLILAVAVFRFVVTAVQQRSHLDWAVGAYLLLGLGLSALGVFSAQWRFKVPFVEQLLGRLPPQLLILPESPDAGISLNQLAGTILMFWPLLLALILGWPQRRYRRSVFVAAALLWLLLTGLLLATQSRSAWIGAVAALLTLFALWAYLMRPSRYRQAAGMLLLFLLLSGVLLAWLAGSDRWQRVWQEPLRETAVGNLNTVSFRGEVWQWSITAVQDFPFTGTGLGTFRRVVFRFYPIAVSPTYDIAHAHNIFLQVALDVGLPGLVAYLALLLVATFSAWQVATNHQEARPLALGILASLVALHAYGLSDALAPGSKPAVLFWYALALIAATATLAQKPPFTTTGSGN